MLANIFIEHKTTDHHTRINSYCREQHLVRFFIMYQVVSGAELHYYYENQLRRTLQGSVFY